jgi:hypothetical protein
MEIEILNKKFSEQYEIFLHSQSETLLFQSWKYQCLIQNLIDCKQNTLIAFDENKKIQAALPLMSMDGSFGVVYNSSAFYGGNGGLVGDNVQARSEIISCYNKIAQDKNTASATIIENPLDQKKRNDQKKYIYQIVDERIGQFTPLSDKQISDQELLSQFHYKTRNMVRKGLKTGVNVLIENSAFEFLFNTHDENMKQIGGSPKPRKFFDMVRDQYIPNTEYKNFVAKLNGEPIAALLTFYYNETVEYYTPVIVSKYRDKQALSTIIFHAMHDAINSGYKWWNWGGTWHSQEGVYRFKSRWGSKDMKYQYKTHIGNKEILNCTKKELLNAYPNFYVVPFSNLGDEDG